MDTASPRRGAALALTLALVLVLGAFGTTLRLLSHRAYRESDLVNAPIRAIAVGEVGFSSITGRLGAAPWSNRWFKTGPDIGYNVAAAGGTYSYLIRNASSPAALLEPMTALFLGDPHQADLLIRATFDRSTVVMFWRLLIPDNTLDSLARVVPTFFVFPPENVQPTSEQVDAVSAQVNTGIDTRTGNQPDFIAVAGPLQQASSASQVAGILGLDPSRPVLDGVSAGGDGGAPLPNSSRLEASHSSGWVFPPIAPVPVPSDTSSSPPSAGGIMCNGSLRTTAGSLISCVTDYLAPRLETIQCTFPHWGLGMRAGLSIVELDAVFAGVLPGDPSSPTTDQRTAIVYAQGVIWFATYLLGGADPITQTCRSDFDGWPHVWSRGWPSHTRSWGTSWGSGWHH